MKAQLTYSGTTVDLDSLLSRSRTIVTVGREGDETYNVIALADPVADLFQCQLSRRPDGQWLLHDGQWRTECPKGIRSRLQHACTMCLGRCVNPRPAHPTYSWRTPGHPTLLNGQPLAPDGTTLRHGDTITAGTTMLAYSEA